MRRKAIELLSQPREDSLIGVTRQAGLVFQLNFLAEKILIMSDNLRWKFDAGELL